MKRASLIVVVRRSDWAGVPEQDAPTTGYTCESVHVNFDGTVTFFSSGKPSTVSQKDVVRIEYAAFGAEFCAFCDQSIACFGQV
jgi:hypothetical protein